MPTWAALGRRTSGRRTSTAWRGRGCVHGLLRGPGGLHGLPRGAPDGLLSQPHRASRARSTTRPGSASASPRRCSPELCRAQGYRTAAFGKWHLGCLPKFMPTRHGFDEYFGIRIAPSSELVRRIELEPDQQTFRAADPILLHQPHFVRPTFEVDPARPAGPGRTA